MMALGYYTCNRCACNVVRLPFRVRPTLHMQRPGAGMTTNSSTQAGHSVDLLSKTAPQLSPFKGWFVSGPCKLTQMRIANMRRDRQQLRLPL